MSVDKIKELVNNMEPQEAASKSYAGYLGTLFMGLTMGVVAAPFVSSRGFCSRAPLGMDRQDKGELSSI
jgi:hypothetical protein